MKRAGMPVLLILVLLLPAHAQEVLRLTEAEAVTRVLEHHRAIRAATYQEREAEAHYRASRTRRFFQVSSQAGYLRFSSNIPDFRILIPTPMGLQEQVIAPAILNRYSLKLQILQPLFTGGALHYRTQAARFQTEATRARTEQLRADLALQTRMAYWQLFEARALARSLEHAVRQVEAHLRDVENFREQGLATEQQVLAVKARLSEVRSRQLAARHAADQARATLNRLLGLPLDQPVMLQVDTTYREIPDTVDETDVLKQRPEVEHLQAVLRSARAGERVARAAYFPQIYLSGTVDYARPNPYIFPPEDRFEGTWNVGVTVSWPLWNWGARRLEHEAAQRRAEALKEQLNDLKEQVRLELYQQRLQVIQMLEQVQAAEEALTAAREAYRVAREHYRQGLARNSEVLQAEAALRQAEGRYFQALAAYRRALARWKRTIGATL